MQQEIQQWTKILLIIERVLHGMEIQIVVIFSCGFYREWMEKKRNVKDSENSNFIYFESKNWQRLKC